MPERGEQTAYRVAPLSRHHDRSTFSCGVEQLDRYIRAQAGQDTRRRVAAAFVLCQGQRNAVVGYYTLSALSIDVGAWPDDIARRLPKYPYVPATLLGRLAVDSSLRGMGWGEHLLMDALWRALQVSRDVGSAAVIVDAKDEGAVAFYRRYGFLPFADQPNRLFLPMSVVEGLFS